MIPSPNLDDRTYKEIVEEAIRLIPHYCPEWTNHNPTDPGITMIELFSWMTEMIIYRLNKVPEKTYLTLLDLVGLSFLPPQSSKGLVSFTPVEGYNGTVRIKRGTQLSTTRSESEGSIVFETERDVVIKNIKLEACFSTKDGRVTENVLPSPEMPGNRGFLFFSGDNEIRRDIYICDPAIGFLQDTNILNITFDCANEIKSMDDEIVNFLEWFYWNGKKWIPIEAKRAVPGKTRQDNEIYFNGPLDIEETEVDQSEGFILKASLADYPKRNKCFEIDQVVSNLIFSGEGLSPELCLCNSENMVFHTLDVSKDFKSFVDIPKYNDAFYIASTEGFSKKDSEIQMNFYLSDSAEVDKPEPNEDLILKFEYWNGKNWLELGTTTTKGVHAPEGKHKFTDSTNCFSRNGIVKFRAPDDLTGCEVNSIENHWIRVRISAGDFGKGGRHIQTEDGKWEWVYDRPVKAPVFNRIRLFYTAAKKPVKELKTYNNFNFRDFSRECHKNYQAEEEKDKTYFTLFQINKEKCPITYLGFDNPFPSGDNGLYFRMNEKQKSGPVRNLLPGIGKIGITPQRGARVISLKWEYWNGSDWKDLSVNDYTDNFHESGFIEFKTPEDLKPVNRFGKELYWIRTIHESGSFEITPRVKSILLNSVYAYNHQTFANEILGSSNGAPSQSFEIFRAPILPGLKLLIKENYLPPQREREQILAEEGEDAIEVTKNSDGGEEVWIRYHEVENFYTSTPTSRHYCVDYIQNKIIFGDGSRGMIPPRLKNNILIAGYMTGGGVVGNVGSHTIKILRENIPYVSEVTNHYSAEGGCDLENMDNLKNRASNVFKNLNRAVTAEDYEWLALEASTSVARSKCLSRCGINGEVIVVIVPRPDTDDLDMKDKLSPSSELIRRVREFLDARKLVGTRLRVEPPGYKTIDLKIKVVFKKDVSEQRILKEQMEQSIRRILHPIKGGTGGSGWDFGMPLTKNEIFQILEKIEGIYYIEEIEIIDKDLEVPVEKLMLQEDSLIYLEEVEITGRQYQY